MKLSHFHASIKTFILFPFPGSPPPPRDLQITDCYNRKTNLSWSPVVSNDASVTHYLIDQESNHKASVFKLVYNVSSPNITSVTLNLPGWATLRFRIRAASSFGPSRPSLPTAEGICTTSVGSELPLYLCTTTSNKEYDEDFRKRLEHFPNVIRTFSNILRKLWETVQHSQKLPTKSFNLKSAQSRYQT